MHDVPRPRWSGGPASARRSPPRCGLCPRARAAVVAVEGEPGIGKSRLLAHLAACAAADGVHGARRARVGVRDRSPVRAVDRGAGRHLADLGERRVARLGSPTPGPPTLLPALAAREPASGDRHRTHRALRDLLERLAAPRALVVCMDDVHWADPASVDALAALVRRPPAAPVLFALAAREGQLPAALAAALAGAHREQRVHGAEPGAAERGRGGRARRRGAPRRSTRRPAATRSTSSSSRACRARRALGAGAADELGAAARSRPRWPPSSPRWRPTRAGCSTRPPWPATRSSPAWPPRSPSCPSPRRCTRSTSCSSARSCGRRGAPRRFAFRHPVVRHAVYVGDARRLAARRARPRGRRAGAPRRRPGAARPPRRVRRPPRRRGRDRAAQRRRERAAGPGPGHRGALSRRRAAAAARPARRSSAAAGCSGCSPTPRPPRATRRPRARRCSTRSRPPGRTTGSALTVALANQEWWLGGHEDAGRRLHVALGELPAQPSPDRIRLRLALGLTALLGVRPRRRAGPRQRRPRRRPRDRRSRLRARGARRRRPGERVGGRRARARHAGSRSPPPRSSGSPPAQLATRLPAFWMHGRARRALGQFEAALADLRRGAAIAEQTGRERVLLILTVESVADAGRARPHRRGDRGGRGGPRARAPGRQPADAAVGAQRARARRGWRPATSPPRCDHAGEAARLGTPAGLPRRRATRLVPRRGA